MQMFSILKNTLKNQTLPIQISNDLQSYNVKSEQESLTHPSCLEFHQLFDVPIHFLHTIIF